MVSWLRLRGAGPIGIDLGTRSVKLVQMSGDRAHLLEAVRWDLPMDQPADFDELARRWTQALCDVREGRRFKGRDAVVTLGAAELTVQNIRVPKAQPEDMRSLILKEIEERANLSPVESEIRYLEAADVRQGEAVRREVIVLGCKRTVLERTLQAVEEAGLKPISVDIEPQALLRCYNAQFRRDADQQQRAVVVHVGNSSTAVVIAEGDDILFVKYIELGGRHFDEAVSRHLKMELPAAWSLRRNNGDRRADQQDPEISRSIAESIRPVVDRLANEVSLCIRYHSVTFRGRPLVRLILGGGEATQNLVERLSGRLDLKCELGDPFRAYAAAPTGGRRSQWDLAVGAALHAVEEKA